MCQIEVTASHLACNLSDLTANPAEPAAVQGDVIGASADGSAVYFVAQGALTAGEGAVQGNCGEHAALLASQSCNLYRYDTTTGATRLVAVLSSADRPDWSAGERLQQLTARVSPNGRYLAFMSERPLTGYDNRDAVSGVRDEEVFLYDAGATAGQGRLLCASCNPTGARPLGVEGPLNPPRDLFDTPGNWPERWVAASIPGWSNTVENTARYQSRYLSDSGRLFFNANDALVPQDSNGTGDVYEFEPPAGEGQPTSNDCSTSSSSFRAVSGGCLSLISSGTSKQESAFLDASESGDDVFFLTASKLVPKDIDSARDVYDARVGGGEPAIVKPVECSGDACQQPAVPPVDATPGSLTFNGAGNALECPKGKVKQKDKCVKKKAKKHKKKHHEKSKHKKSNKQKAQKQKNNKRANSKHGGHK